MNQASLKEPIMIRLGEVVTLNTRNKSWRQVTIQPYHGLKAEIIKLSKTTDLMAVRILNSADFKRAHPNLSTTFVYMPKWAAEKPKCLMEPE